MSKKPQSLGAFQSDLLRRAESFANANDYPDVSIGRRETEKGYRFTIDIVVPELQEYRQSLFARLAKMNGVHPDVFGKSFKRKSLVFTITGVRPNATKNQVEITNQNGKVYVCGWDMIRKHLVDDEQDVIRVH